MVSAGVVVVYSRVVVCDVPTCRSLLLLVGRFNNLCFTGGWIVELFIAQVWGLRPARFGPVAFGLGLLGSIVITLIPAAVILLVDGLTLLFHALGYQTVAPQ